MEHYDRRFMLGGAAVLAGAGMLVASEARAQASAESTFERVQRTKKLRVSALPGTPPYFEKNSATGQWSGGAVESAKDIAKVFDAEVVFHETTASNSILDLQTNKIDIAFALNSTPQRALAVSFSRPMIQLGYGVIAKPGLSPKTWAEINDSKIKLAFEIGTLHEQVVKFFAPKAQASGFKTKDDVTLSLNSRRVDYAVLSAILGISAVGKNPSLGTYHILDNPVVSLPVGMAVRREIDTRFLEVLNAWTEYTRGIGQIRTWFLDALIASGVDPSTIPSEVVL